MSPFQKRAVAWFDAYFLPAGVVAAIVLGLLAPGAGRSAVQLLPGSADHTLIVVIFFFSGLMLSVKEAFGRKLGLAPFAITTALQFVVAPTTTILLQAIFHFSPSQFLGMAAISVVPPTLSSAVVVTRQAAGNEGLALILTLLLTLAGTFASPLLLGLLLGHGDVLSLPVMPLIFKLGQLVLLPLLAGQAIKRTIFQRPPNALKYIPSFCIILIVWFTVCANAEAVGALGFFTWINFLAVGVAMHVVWFVIAVVASRLGALPRSDQIAVSYCASQKTLPMAVALLTLALARSPQSALLATAIAFCVLFHVAQIVLDSSIAARWKTAGEKLR